jgi:hypothetical protein
MFVQRIHVRRRCSIDADGEAYFLLFAHAELGDSFLAHHFSSRMLSHSANQFI